MQVLDTRNTWKGDKNWRKNRITLLGICAHNLFNYN